MVEIKNKYKNGLPETVEAAQLLETFMDTVNGTSNLYILCVKGYEDEVCKRLNLGEPSPLPEVKGGDVLLDVSPKELRELTLRVIGAKK